jgi:hypothetical protein
MDFKDWLALPLYLQVTLGCGYLAYVIAYAGKRNEEKTLDILLGTVLLSLPSTIVWLGSDYWALPEWGKVLEALVVALLVGVAWRKWGMNAWFGLMHQYRVSNSDINKTTWQRITQDMQAVPTQLQVVLNSGVIYMCEDVQAYSDAVIPRYRTDLEGNVALYVSCWFDEEGIRHENESVRYHGWGDELTYIPASEIKQVIFRIVRD